MSKKNVLLNLPIVECVLPQSACIRVDYTLIHHSCTGTCSSFSCTTSLQRLVATMNSTMSCVFVQSLQFFRLYVRLPTLCLQNQIANVETYSLSDKCVSWKVLGEYLDSNSDSTLGFEWICIRTKYGYVSALIFIIVVRILEQWLFLPPSS